MGSVSDVISIVKIVIELVAKLSSGSADAPDVGPVVKA